MKGGRPAKSLLADGVELSSDIRSGALCKRTPLIPTTQYRHGYATMQPSSKPQEASLDYSCVIGALQLSQHDSCTVLIMQCALIKEAKVSHTQPHT